MAKCYEILETLNCKTKKQNTNQICEGNKKHVNNNRYNNV